MTQPTIYVEGDRYLALFSVPAKIARGIDHDQIVAVTAGAPYIQTAVEFLLKLSSSGKEKLPRVKLSNLVAPYLGSPNIYAGYSVKKIEEVLSLTDPLVKQPLVRTSVSVTPSATIS